MKRNICAVVILFFIAVSFNCKKEDRTVARQGLINFVTGNVKIVNAQGAKADAKIGDSITEGMSVITSGDKSVADVYFGENAIKILGNTSVEVKTLVMNITKNSEQTVLFVNNGALFSSVKKLSKNDDYRIKSPTATAGVRGTDFLVEEKDGKANVACLEGKVECQNNTNPDADAVIIADREEVDVVRGEDMVKKQISQDRMNMLNIKLRITELREDIRRKYLQQKEEMRKYVEDQRQRDRTMVENQREGDRQRVEDQKARDRANIDAVKGDTTARQKESTEAAQSMMNQAKDAASSDSVKQGAKSQIDALRKRPTVQNPLQQNQ
ncbi:MAG TPA: FecR domain-containing protein [Spirochaetota bacterium]|nr:FecR domain-containing protein [Spirochaetota bacterium]HPJ38091.1 FecR domain-containing protein [Spirochaetota bacterium]HPQ51875.1 FecR domain-containing protein [Spirochaetota bacterium]